MRKINFKKAVTQKVREYDQKLNALTNFNLFEAFEKAVQAKVLAKIKKLLPTHIPKVVANYVRPRLNTSVLDVMKNNQINQFTQSSTSTDDLLKMDLKLELLNRIYESKSNTTHPTNQKLYDTLYESVYLDHVAHNAQDAEPSFHKRSHDNQDSPNNCEGEKKKKHIDQNKNHILAPSSVAIANKIKAIIQKDKLTIADLEVRRSDDKEYEFSYADLPRLSLNNVEDMCFLQVQDKLHHLPLEFVKHFNNALLLSIKRVNRTKTRNSSWIV
ncbi:hypothetical protein Tco_0737821 [Tanacetum coccineum]